jgi:uncharacterized protein
MNLRGGVMGLAISLLRRGLVIAAVAVLAACGGGDPIGSGSNGSIRGTVTDNTGAAVPNAAVELSGNGQPARSTTSGADGVYTFANLPTGTYTLAVTPPTAFVTGATGTTSVTVAAGAQANAAAFVLDRVNANGSIRGTVRDASGVSVANAAIALTGNGQAARTANSGADGVYTFAGVPAGTYTLTVTAPAGFTISLVEGTVFVAVAGGAQANASPFVLNRVPVDPCPLARPDYGGSATAADRALFTYDANAPLNLQKTVEISNSVFELSAISYTSPAGGLVTGIMTEPVGRTGLRPGLIIMHPSGSATIPGAGARMEVGNAQMYAFYGAVVIAIDAPYARRGGVFTPLFTGQDRAEQIQLMQDLQRAVDVLRARPDVDPERIGFIGYSYGGMIAAHFAGIETRLKAAVVAAGYGGWVTHYTTPWGLSVLGNLPCTTRNAWLQAMTPIEAIRFIPDASPTELLFQIARFDNAVLLEDAQALYNAASNPKEVGMYDTDHGFNARALYDRHLWLHQKIGVDAPPPFQ